MARFQFNHIFFKEYPMIEMVNNKKLFIFGKDSTICKSVVEKNGRTQASKSREFQEYYDDVTPVVDKLRAEGHQIAVVSNQGGVAFSIMDAETADLLVKAAAEFVGAVAYKVCLCHPKGKVAQYAIETEDRLPRPGMILSLMHEFGFLPQDTIVVGDWQFEKDTAAIAGVPFIYADQVFNRT